MVRSVEHLADRQIRLCDKTLFRAGLGLGQVN